MSCPRFAPRTWMSNIRSNHRTQTRNDAPQAANGVMASRSAIDRLGRAPRGDDAREQKRALEPAPAVTAAATKPGGLTDRIKAPDRIAFRIDRATLQVGDDATQRLARDDVFAHRDEGPRFRI